jgi:hypothetical protein
MLRLSSPVLSANLEDPIRGDVKLINHTVEAGEIVVIAVLFGNKDTEELYGYTIAEEEYVFGFGIWAGAPIPSPGTEWTASMFSYAAFEGSFDALVLVAPGYVPGTDVHFVDYGYGLRPIGVLKTTLESLLENAYTTIWFADVLEVVVPLPPAEILELTLSIE